MRGVALTYAFDQRDPTIDPHLNDWTMFAVEELVRAPRGSAGSEHPA
ncbi:hypothetical protein [Nocardia sp. NPDC052112]